ncbi:MAG TPA: helix-hairpin-helix domain-containing protein [Patescibacteria group bacterium]|nr:helix-hairpin-helix domain-containing protein [Patescibacteria group bacterium]
MSKLPFFKNRLQMLLGITKGELSFVLLILGGLTVWTIHTATGFKNEESPLAEDVYRMLDSLAEAGRSTITGIDAQGNANAELAAGDTIVTPEEFFPTAKRKELLTGKINLKTAVKSELMRLPGIGEKTAEAIIEHRKASPFKKPSDIMNVKGIGEKKFEKMREFIEVK